MDIGSLWRGIDHVQLAIPVGGELLERGLYVGARRIRVGVECDSASVSNARRASSIEGWRGGRP